MVAIVLYLMQYVKQNFLTFYNHNDQALYSLARDKNNQQQIDKAVEYIQSKVSSNMI